jgi:hypothetical protein
MEWFKSTRCADTACVEVATTADNFVALRDSKRPEQHFLRFDRVQWSTFIEGIKAGDFGGR